jgi:hypothetical protein
LGYMHFNSGIMPKCWKSVLFVYGDDYAGLSTDSRANLSDP